MTQLSFQDRVYQIARSLNLSTSCAAKPLYAEELCGLLHLEISLGFCVVGEAEVERENGITQKG